MITNPLKLEFDGILTKRSDKNDAVRAFQIKIVDHGELVSIVRELEKWGNNHNVPELQNLTQVIAATDNPWDKMNTKLGDYGLFVKVDHGHEIYSDLPGILYEAKMGNIAWTYKDGELNAVLTLLKNGDDVDDKIVRSFLNHKEEDENGKMVPKPLPIIFEQIDSFVLGNAPEKKNSDSDDDEPEDLTTVYVAP